MAPLDYAAKFDKRDQILQSGNLDQRHAAKLDWLQWPRGTDDTDFPPGVVKSDPQCNHMVGRHMGDNVWHLRQVRDWKKLNLRQILK